MRWTGVAALSVSLALAAAACGSRAVSGGDAALAPDGARAASNSNGAAASSGSSASADAGLEPRPDAGAGGAGGAAGNEPHLGAADDLDASAANPDDPCGPNHPAAVPLPSVGPGSFDVTAYGTVGDGKSDDTRALQAALDAAAAVSGGTVLVPPGTYLSGPIVMHSNTRLELSAGALLEMLPMDRYPGATPFITADSAHDIALSGAGTIEGQGQAWWNALDAQPKLERPQQVSFSHSVRVSITGIRLQNSPEEHIWVKGDSDVTITGITISTLALAGQHVPSNTDGVDIGANGVFFCNNQIACGDDNVVMSGQNIYVGYSKFGVGHGCSIGSITKNGVSNVTVEHVTMNGTTSGIRMKSARDRGGVVEHLVYSNMTLTNVQNPVYITSYYPSLPADPASDAAQALSATTPQWRDITIKDVTITGAANAGILWGLPEQKIAALSFDNVHIEAKTGMQIFHATGVAFVHDSTVVAKSGAAVTTYDADVSGIKTTAR